LRTVTKASNLASTPSVGIIFPPDFLGCQKQGSKIGFSTPILLAQPSKPVTQLKNMNCSPNFLNWLRRWRVFAALFGLFFTFTPVLPAAIIGTNSPTQPLTAGRIAALPRAQQPAWKEYLKRSTRQLRADQTFLQAEMRQHGIKQLGVPPPGQSAGSIPLNHPAPSPEIAAAVNAAAAWFEKTKIYDLAFKFDYADGRRLVPAPGNGPIWSRYYEIGTDRPVFGDRDKSIHDNVNEIPEERRNGYSWYNDTPKRRLEHYADWKILHAQ
jgi:hypothetical protein